MPPPLGRRSKPCYGALTLGGFVTWWYGRFVGQLDWLLSGGLLEALLGYS